MAKQKKSSKKKINSEEPMIIEENKEEVFTGTQSGKYKYLYTELIYKTLYDVVCGIPVKTETNFSMMLKRTLEHAMAATHTIEINNLIKLLISACPSRVYEEVNGEDIKHEKDNMSIDDMLAKMSNR